jgi:hypothetical protein
VRAVDENSQSADFPIWSPTGPLHGRHGMMASSASSASSLDSLPLPGKKLLRAMLPSEVRTGADAMTVGNRMLSKSAWEELKPTSRNLYLDQTQTLRQLAEYIQEHHGVKPTYV